MFHITANIYSKHINEDNNISHKCLQESSNDFSLYDDMVNNMMKNTNLRSRKRKMRSTRNVKRIKKNKSKK